MSKSGQLRLARTKDIPVPNEYILALSGEFGPWSYDEEAAPLLRSRWRSEGFGGKADEFPVDLEIGTGNGLHFAHRSIHFPERGLVGIELKYKPLIQSIRRARRAGMENARMVRYNAYLIQDLFAPCEINDVFIYFPDPWEKSRQHKHRLIQDEFLRRLHEIQRPGSRLYFKTDSRDYFEWSLERFQRAPFYKMLGYTFDLHASDYRGDNFITQFEQLFIRQGLKIGWACMERL